MTRHDLQLRHEAPEELLHAGQLSRSGGCAARHVRLSLCIGVTWLLVLLMAPHAQAASWSAASPPNPAGKGRFLEGVSCVSDSFCEAVGHFENPSIVELPLIEEWASSWSLQATVPTPAGTTSARLSGVSCVTSSFCEAVGVYRTSSGVFPLAEEWNGTTWEDQTPPIPAGSIGANLDGVSCVTSKFCEAVGAYSKTAKEVKNLGDKWNGTSWEVQTPTNPIGTAELSELHGASCTSVKFCEAVGQYRNSSGKELTVALEWNGTSWELQTSANQTGKVNRLSAVSCISPEFCEGVGWYVNTAGTEQFTLGEKWSGASWELQATNPVAELTYLAGVSCTSASLCEAVGRSQSSGSLAEGWNGIEWKVQTTPAPSGATITELYGVSCVAMPFCQAGGRYINTAAEEKALAEEYK
jgi:hypothetical protein